MPPVYPSKVERVVMRDVDVKRSSSLWLSTVLLAAGGLGCWAVWDGDVPILKLLAHFRTKLISDLVQQAIANLRLDLLLDFVADLDHLVDIFRL